jgi:DUF1680 family protein
MSTIFDASIAPGGKFSSEFRKDLLGGIVVLKHDGVISENSLSDAPLYARLETGKGHAATKPVELTLIPYYAWANRGPAAMEVWIPAR